MATGYTTVSASNLCDATGNKISNATAYFQPCNSAGKALSFCVDGSGQTIDTPVSAPVSNGAFSIALADTSLTSPANVAYLVTVINNVTGANLLGPGYLIQPTGANWDFDTFIPNVPALATIQTGPTGATGATGPANTLTIGTVSTGAAGSAAAATITGYAPNQTLSLTIPQGIQGIQGQQGVQGPATLPIYASAANALSAIASGNYFLIPSSTADGSYDIYQNESGSALFVATIPARLITSSTSQILTITDKNGFAYSVASLIQTLQSQVAAIEQEGLTVFSTTTAALAAGLGNGAFFFIPSATNGGAYDVYQNNSGVARFVLTIAALSVVSDGVHRFSAQDKNGWCVDVVDSQGNVPVMANALATRDLATAIALLNQQCATYSRTIFNTFNSTMAAPEYQYNFMPWYGQSLSCGEQTIAFVSTAAKYGNLMVGQTPRKTTASGADGPQGDSLFHPLVESIQSTAAGETECSGMANTAKAMLNRWRLLNNDTQRYIVTNSLGQPGEPVVNLIPTAAPPSGSSFNYWDTIPAFMTAAAADAASAGGTYGGGGVVGPIGATGFFYIQGENDNNDIATDPTYTTYMSNVLSIRAGFDALCQSTFGQTRQAGFYTSQVGDTWTDDATGLAIQNAQWIMALQNPNWFLFGPYYPYPDLGSASRINYTHLTANSYCWLGAMAGKVWFRTAVLRQGWMPVMPHKVTMFNSTTLLIGYHVPVPPLTIGTAYVGSTACNYSDLGFNLFDANGYIPATVSIVADQVIQIVASRAVDWTTCYLNYADTGGGAPGGAVHTGVGNVCDSDPAVADDIYVASANESGTPDGTQFDYPSLIGNPYPLMNWSIAFHLKPYTFNTTGPTVGF